MLEELFEQEQHILGQNVELLDDTSLAELRRYKYSSIDLSYTTKYILNPFWTWCAEFMPPWLAPNVITLIGISAILSNILLILIFIPDLESEGPRWIYFYFAISLIFYQTMDNIDGKQARKTKSSSPLGELFDHGIDSLNCCWAAVVQTASMGLGSTSLGAVTTLSTTIAMYLSTWETYYTKTLFLGVLNGPTEGILICCVAHCMSGFYGPQIWNTEISVLGTSYHLKSLWNYAVILGVLIGHLPNCLYNVYMKLKEQGETARFQETLKDLLPMVYMALGVFLWLSSPTSTILADNHLLLFALTASFIFGRTTTCIILSHLCHQPFPTLSFPLLLLYVGCFMYGFLAWLGLDFQFISEMVYLRFLFLASGAYFFAYAKLVIDKLCGYLGIRCYTIPH